MLGVKEELQDWYEDLNEPNKMLLWQRFSTYLNTGELKRCMAEVKKGKHDLFEIHYKHGLIDKYQIYFHQIMRSINVMEDEHGREN